MIFFFDYLYMQCCDLYKRDKHERLDGSWRISGMMMVAGTTSWVTAFIIMFIFKTFFLESIRDDRELVLDFMLYFKVIIVVILLLLFLVLGIRYKKFITYEQIVGKVRELSKIQKVILNILVGVYLFTALPLFIIYAIYVSPIV